MEMPQQPQDTDEIEIENSPIDTEEYKPIIICVNDVTLIVTDNGLDIVVDIDEDRERRHEFTADEAHSLTHAMVGLIAMMKGTRDLF